MGHKSAPDLGLIAPQAAGPLFEMPLHRSMAAQ